MADVALFHACHNRHHNGKAHDKLLQGPSHILVLALEMLIRPIFAHKTVTMLRHLSVINIIC